MNPQRAVGEARNGHSVPERHAEHAEWSVELPEIGAIELSEPDMVIPQGDSPCRPSLERSRLQPAV